jgi:tryptophan-rich sensory protein
MLEVIISIIFAELVGGVSGFLTSGSIQTWFQTLIQPSFQPPNWLFGPAWTLLYALMGIAAAWIWKKRKNKKARIALGIYGVQLFLNFIWSIIFFGLHSPFWALIDVVLLWGLIMWMIMKFYVIDKKAGWILIPYLAWVTFATVLNFAIWRLN